MKYTVRTIANRDTHNFPWAKADDRLGAIEHARSLLKNNSAAIRVEVVDETGAVVFHDEKK